MSGTSLGYCIRTATDCEYRSDNGRCLYQGNGCAYSLVRSVRVDETDFKIVKYSELSDETISKIADAVIERLKKAFR